MEISDLLEFLADQNQVDKILRKEQTVVYI